VVQQFIGSPHEATLVDVLATVEDQALSAEQAEAQLRAAIDRWWANARRQGVTVVPEGVAQTAEEVERLRQLALAEQVARRSGAT